MQRAPSRRRWGGVRREPSCGRERRLQSYNRHNILNRDGQRQVDLVVPVDGRPIQEEAQHLPSPLVRQVVQPVASPARPLDDVLAQHRLLRLRRLPGAVVVQRLPQSLKALWNLDRKKRLDGEVIATPGEILREDEERAFERDSATDDTRVRTAVAWLEDAVLLSREENLVQVFPSSMRVATLDEARAKLVQARVTDDRRRQLLAIVGKLIEADADEGISTDELMNTARLTPEEVRGRSMTSKRWASPVTTLC